MRQNKCLAITLAALIAWTPVFGFPGEARADGPGKVSGAFQQRFGGEVRLSGATDGQVATWDAATRSWIPATGGGGGSQTLAQVLAQGASTGGTAGSHSITFSSGDAILGSPAATLGTTTATSLVLSGGLGFSAGNFITTQSNAPLVIGVGSSTVQLQAETSGSFGMKAAATTSTYSIVWPAAHGGAGTVLTDAAGNGTLSWASAGGGSSGWSYSSPTVTLTTSTDQVGIGTAPGPIRKLDVIGDATNTNINFKAGPGGSGAVVFDNNENHGIIVNDDGNDPIFRFFGPTSVGVGFYSNGDVVLNDSNTALAQNATAGFAWLPQCATGAPTGTPAGSYTGAVAMQWGGDNHLYGDPTHAGAWVQVDGGSGTLTPPATLTYATNNSSPALAISRVLTSSGNGAADALRLTVGHANVDGAGAAEESALLAVDGAAGATLANTPRALVDTVQDSTATHGAIYGTRAGTGTDSGGGVTHLFRRCRGTIASPSSVQSGDTLGALLGVGYVASTGGDNCPHFAWLSLDVDPTGTLSTSSFPGMISLRTGTGGGAIPGSWSVRSYGSLVGGSDKILGFMGASNTDSSSNHAPVVGISQGGTGVLAVGGGNTPGDTSGSVQATGLSNPVGDLALSAAGTNASVVIAPNGSGVTYLSGANVIAGSSPGPVNVTTALSVWRSGGGSSQLVGRVSGGSLGSPSSVAVGAVALSLQGLGYVSGTGGDNMVFFGHVDVTADPAHTVASQIGAVTLAPNNGSSTVPILSIHGGGQVAMPSTAVLGFASNANPDTTLPDAAFSRIGTGVIGIGTGAAGNLSGQLQLTGATGAGTVIGLGANCPAITLTAPYTWLKFISDDGSQVYVAAYK